MEFSLSEEQRAIQDMARRFAAEELAPHAALWDAEKIFPVEALRKAASLGFAGLLGRADYGGSELGRFEGALVFEALASGCTTTSAYLSIHNMVGYLIESFGSEAQKSRFLPDLYTMDKFSAYCLTEPGHGSDAANLQTRAEKQSDGSYLLNGGKAFISGGGRADLYLVMARSGGPGADGVSCFMVEAGQEGLSFGAQERKLGWNAQPTAMVLFENCRVLAENRLGDEGEGFKIAMRGLDGGRVNIAACSVGTADAALEASRTYMVERKQFGRRLADFQALQFRLADMATQLEAARLMTYRAAWAADAAQHNTTADVEGDASKDEAEQDTDKTMLAAMAKRFATDAGFDICNQALQLHGGYGYLQDFPLERYLRDNRVHMILEGTNEIMRLIIARHLLNENK